MSQLEIAPFGIFTLVSYVPPPLGGFLDSLRQSLPGDGCPQAHITLVPPRPLRVPLVNASAYAQSVVSRFFPFKAVLGSVRHFPETNVLYLDIAQGQDEIHSIHDALNSGALAHREQFEFRPHLTVGGPVPPAELPSTRQRISDSWRAHAGPREFHVSEVVALWFDSANGTPEWTRVWTRRLKKRPAGHASAASDQTS